MMRREIDKRAMFADCCAQVSMSVLVVAMRFLWRITDYRSIFFPRLCPSNHSAKSRKIMSACPHIDRDDPRCASRLCLGKLDQAFCVCFGAYRSCLMYHRINSEHERNPQSNLLNHLLALTSDGNNLPLRQTGT